MKKEGSQFKNSEVTELMISEYRDELKKILYESLLLYSAEVLKKRITIDFTHEDNVMIKIDGLKFYLRCHFSFEKSDAQSNFK